MTLDELRLKRQEELELLAPILSQADSDRCMALGEDFIRSVAISLNEQEATHSTSNSSPDSTICGLLSSLKRSLDDRGRTLAMLPTDKFASRQLGLDLLTYSELNETHPFPEAELLKLVLARFQARTNYWREVALLLLCEEMLPCANL